MLISTRDRKVLRSVRTCDAFQTFDQRTLDSTGSFLIGELERLDPKLHLPLFSCTYTRDIDLRNDVTIADEVSSFSLSNWAAPGMNNTGKNWISKEANAISGVALDIGKKATPLTLWGMTASFTIPELESAMRLGRPVDEQKLLAIRNKFQMDTDEQVYIGDTNLGVYGLLNSTDVTPTNVLNDGTGNSTLWANKTADQILRDVNTFLTNAYAASGYAICPNRLLLPPQKFSYLLSQKVSSAGNVSILEFLRINSISYAYNGTPLEVQPVKWLTGRGALSADRMVAYYKDYDYVRFPMTMLMNTPVQFVEIWQRTTYYGRLGAVEIVRPETVAYADGI